MSFIWYSRKQRNNPYEKPGVANPHPHTPGVNQALPMYAKVNKDASRSNTMQQKATGTGASTPGTVDPTLPPPPTGDDLLRLCNSPTATQHRRHGSLRPQQSTDTSRGQQASSEGDYLIPCHTGTTASRRAANSVYDTVGVMDGSEVSANDDYWVAESNFKFYSPQKNS